MGLFKSIKKAVLGPQESDYSDRKSYLKARLAYKRKEAEKLETHMRETGHHGATASNLDRLAKIHDEIRGIEREL